RLYLHSFPTRRSSDLIFFQICQKCAGEGIECRSRMARSLETHGFQYLPTREGPPSLPSRPLPRFKSSPRKKHLTVLFIVRGRGLDRKSTRLNSSHRTI